jgi:uncharacterized protein with HEPN domain
MWPEERDAARLWDMLQAAREVVEMTAGVSLEDFLKNRVLVRATERCIEIIGEAARRVSAAFQQTHPAIPWGHITGQRNLLAHEYGRIDYELLFKTAAEDVPQLIQDIEQLLPPPDEECQDLTPLT